MTIAFQTAAGAAASKADGRLWGSTCELASTGFVLYGNPDGGLPLAVLRLDGAGVDQCAYTEEQTAKFEAELALYNTVASAGSYVLAFGVSPFLPYAQLTRPDALGYREAVSYSFIQPGEIWMQAALSGSSNAAVVLTQRVTLHTQAVITEAAAPQTLWTTRTRLAPQTLTLPLSRMTLPLTPTLMTLARTPASALPALAYPTSDSLPSHLLPSYLPLLPSSPTFLPSSPTFLPSSPTFLPSYLWAEESHRPLNLRRELAQARPSTSCVRR